MGIFVEALSIAAAHRGLAVEDEPILPLESYSADALRGRADPWIPFAHLSLEPAPAVTPEFPLECLRTRRTSRLPYEGVPVSTDATSRLQALASQGGHRYVPIVDARQIETLLGFNIDAVFEDLNHPAYRKELRGWLRYSDQRSARLRDGLDARCMNTPPVELWTAFHLPALLRWPWLGTRFRRRYRAQIGPVATMGFLCGPFWAPEQAYPSGRLLLRFWLECTRWGYFIHPYGNLVTNRVIAKRVEAETGLADVWLAFKIGRSAPPPASHRRPLEEVLLG